MFFLLTRQYLLDILVPFPKQTSTFHIPPLGPSLKGWTCELSTNSADVISIVFSTSLSLEFAWIESKMLNNSLGQSLKHCSYTKKSPIEEELTSGCLHKKCGVVGHLQTHHLLMRDDHVKNPNPIHKTQGLSSILSGNQTETFKPFQTYYLEKDIDHWRQTCPISYVIPPNAQKKLSA